MNILQQYQLWVGLGFAAALIVFLIVVFFKKGQLSDDQRQILRFLCSLCAGFSGIFITGDALFKLDANLGESTKLLVQGTAGAALFFTVWFTYETVATPGVGYNFKVPDGWTFETAVQAMTKQDGSVPEFVGFTDEEMNSSLRAQKIETSTIMKAIESLRHLVDGTAIRNYSVERDQHILRLKVSP